MEQSDKDTGTLAALMLELEEVRLPRALRILGRVNGGEILSERDIRFLKSVYRDSRINGRLLKRHPTYSGLISRCLVLYTEIITKGLENETKAQ